MATMPVVNIGIVTYNSLNDLPRCLEGIVKQTYPHVIVSLVDNASVDGSLQWAERNLRNSMLIANSTNVGFGQAHNQIIQRCRLNRHDFYMPLNPDIVLAPAYIEKLVDALQSNDAGCGSGKLYHMDEMGAYTNRIYSAGQGILRSGHVVNIGENMVDSAEFSEAREVFFVSGAAPLYRYSLIEDLSENGEFFDASMFMYVEDADVGWRARRNGWRCWYEPGALAYHRGGKAAGEIRAQALGNTFLMSTKNAFLFDFLTCNLPYMILSWIAHFIVSPYVGFVIARQFIRFGTKTWRRRSPAKIPRSEMLKWFAWSGKQTTSQALTLRKRLLDYVNSVGER